MRKALWLGLFGTFMAGSAIAQVPYQGYVRNNGTYVQPHYQSNPNNTRLDNYSTQGNVNPFTGQQGTVNPYNTQPRGGSIYSR